MTLVIEKWVRCTDCGEKCRPEDQNIEEGDKMVHICSPSTGSGKQ